MTEQQQRRDLGHGHTNGCKTTLLRRNDGNGQLLDSVKRRLFASLAVKSATTKLVSNPKSERAERKNHPFQCCRIPRLLRVIVFLLLMLSLLFRNNMKVEQRPQSLFRTTTEAATTATIKRGKVYECGYSRRKLIKALFPDFELMGTWQGMNNNNNATTSNVSTIQSSDILVMGMRGPCPKKKPNNGHFNGTVIYVNGEPEGDISELNSRSESPHWNRVYQLGPYRGQSTKNSIQVYHVAAYLIEKIHQSMWDWIFDMKQKPQNTGANDAVIYVAKNCAKYRQLAAQRISTVIPIKFGGQCSVSSPNAQKVIMPNARDEHWENWRIYKDYKYCLVMENTKISGYVSEKILLAFLGGCIPVYWGTDEIFEIFNRDAFIYYDINNSQKTIDEIKYLQSNTTAYVEKLKYQRILQNVTYAKQEIFSLTDEIGNGKLKHFIRTKIGLEPNFSN